MELKDRPTGKEHFFHCAEKQKVLPFNVTSQPSEIGESGRQNTVQKKCFFNPRSLSEKPCNGEFYLSLLLYIYFLYKTNQIIKHIFLNKKTSMRILN